MLPTPKSSARRAAIRESRPDTAWIWWSNARADGTLTGIGVAVVFWALAVAILMLREEVVPYRPGQMVSHDIVSRVDYSFKDADLLTRAQSEAREREPRVYRKTDDPWGPIQEKLLALPDRVSNHALGELPPDLKDVLDAGSLTAFQQYSASPKLREGYAERVTAYVQSLRDANLVILPREQRADEVKASKSILLQSQTIRPAENSYGWPAGDDLRATLQRYVSEPFRLELQPKILEFTLRNLRPTFELDEGATIEAQNRAADRVPTSEGQITYKKNQPLVRKGLIDQHAWQLLRAEQQAYISTLGPGRKAKMGLAAIVALLTAMLCVYVAHYQPRIVRNHARAIAVGGLLLSMLLLAELAGIGSGPVYLFAIAPTLLVAMILTIAYDQRFGLGIACVHGLLVTVGLDQSFSFLLVSWIGTITCCFMVRDVRTRSRLIEVGGVAALLMMAATFALGLMQRDPLPYIANTCLYVGAAGLSVGFVVLGILPFVEKSFRITTGMTLLELADASHPLLRRLAIEAPGTYNHSLQVATLSEAAAEAIGANSLLCRVASYYHDVGKINKSDYFVENQQPGQENRHMNLTPSVSLLIIIGHVKDGIELAREYHLPTSVFPFIQQHHGTTLVEYFYHQACEQYEQKQQTKCCDEPAIQETQYRYPGPKPKTREVGIVMLADCCESATRAMSEPTPSRIEQLVHDLTLKRLMDGQFDDCELTMRELRSVQKALVKALMSIYHGRIAYPSNMSSTTVSSSNSSVSMRSA